MGVIMNIDNVENIVDKALSLENRQIRNEFYGLCKEFDKSNRFVVLEVGVMSGATLAAFSMLQHKQLEIYNSEQLIYGVQWQDIITTIGIDNACWPVKRSEEQYRNFICWNFGIINHDYHKNNINLIVGDSHSQDTIDKVESILGDRKIDFIFIDADHNYNAVKDDYNMYLKYMNSNSIMAFHDIFKLHGYAIGAATFWNEIKSSYKHLEIRDNDNTPANWESGGIGVLYL